MAYNEQRTVLSSRDVWVNENMTQYKKTKHSLFSDGSHTSGTNKKSAERTYSKTEIDAKGKIKKGQKCTKRRVLKFPIWCH